MNEIIVERHIHSESKKERRIQRDSTATWIFNIIFNAVKLNHCRSMQYNANGRNVVTFGVNSTNNPIRCAI